MRRASVVDGLRILVVDDNPDARTLTSYVLEARGAEVTTAESAMQAREALSAQSFDVLVSDIAMPGEDGYRLVQSLRDEVARVFLPAIALTAFDSAADREAAFAAGFDAHVSKAAPAEELLRAIGQAQRRASKTSATFATPTGDEAGVARRSER